ncbi:MAG: potassium channel protein [Deltaproteobacteria bacterium]|nr:potassium channel protein [Deltaproteobacteria bacterium]
MDIRRRLYCIMLAVILVFIFGSLGYYVLFNGRHSLIDCVFMTTISLTSVGYGEVIKVTGNPPAQIFTMVLITFGMGIILYGISTLTALLIEGELTDILRKKKMEKRINRLDGHYILCGGGETGRPLLNELIKNLEIVVLIEADEKMIENCLAVYSGLLYIKGDASDDENLVRAGIDRAKGIIISLPSDKDNLYVTMTARMMNRNIRIISRMTDPKIMSKLKKAGADSVVSPNFIGAMRMASEMIRPTAVDFLDQMLRSGDGNLRIHEIPITRESSFLGKSIRNSGLKYGFNLLILGVKDVDGRIIFNPSTDMVLETGMTLIIMGNVAQIKKARDAA